MNFLFTPLPETNFQMSDDELKLWQRNAIFECECDNFINRRVESVQSAPNFYHCQLRRPLLMHTAIEAAISSYGLQPQDENDVQPPPMQRRRLFASRTEQAPDTTLDGFYQEAIAMAIRDRGVGLRKDP